MGDSSEKQKGHAPAPGRVAASTHDPEEVKRLIAARAARDTPVSRRAPATALAGARCNGVLVPCYRLGVDVVLSVPLFVGFALVAILALVLLKRTRFFWFPGAALVGYGISIYIAWPWYDTHEDVGGLEGLSNVLHVAVSLVVVAGGIACLIIGARSRQRARRGRRSEIPTAVVER